MSCLAGRRLNGVVLLVLGLGAAACGRLPETTERVQQAQLTAYAELGFAPQPAYVPNNVIVLTFDDGPDAVHTPQVLDLLAARQVKASFFINTVNYGNVANDPALQAIVKRIVAEGHELGNHSIHHTDFETLTPEQIDAELAGVEELLKRPELFGAQAPRLTLVRSPFGRPYQRNDPGMPNEARLKVGPAVARHGVHIGWNISVHDSGCADSACVLNNFLGYAKTVGMGNYGIVLLHSVHARTLQALPQIIDHCKANGFVFGTVESVVRMKYGKSSAELTDAWRAQSAGDPDAGARPAPPADPARDGPPPATDAMVVTPAGMDMGAGGGPGSDTSAPQVSDAGAQATDARADAAADAARADASSAGGAPPPKPSTRGGGCSFSGF